MMKTRLYPKEFYTPVKGRDFVEFPVDREAWDRFIESIRVIDRNTGESRSLDNPFLSTVVSAFDR